MSWLVKAGRVAGVVLATAGALALFVFLRFLSQGLSGQRRFNTWLDIVLYYVLPAVLAASFIASLRLGPASRLRLVLSAAALAVSLYTVELFLVFFPGAQMKALTGLDDSMTVKPVMAVLARSGDKQAYAAKLTAKFGRPVDIRGAKQLLADLKQRGVEAVPIVTPSNHLFLRQPDGSIRSAIRIDGREVMPLAGVSRTVTLLCNENGQWIDYLSDSRGFNNPDEVWASRGIDVAALGDSFTQGYCVPGGSGFVDLVRRRDAATLNLGIAGDGPLLMLATLDEYLPRLAPKIVLWCYFEGNDLTDLQTERKSALLRAYLKPGFSQPDLARQREIDGAMTAELPRIEASVEKAANTFRSNALVYGLLAFAKLTSLRERLAPLANTDPIAVEEAADFEGRNMQLFRAILSEARTRTASWNGQMYFVYLPEWARYTSYSSWGKTKRQEVLDVVRSLGIPLIDIDPVFEAHGDPLSLFPFRGVGHYTEAGHRLVAEEVLRRIPPSALNGSH